MDTSGMAVEAGWLWLLVGGSIIVMIIAVLSYLGRTRCPWCASRRLEWRTYSDYVIENGVCRIDSIKTLACLNCGVERVKQ